MKQSMFARLGKSATVTEKRRRIDELLAAGEVVGFREDASKDSAHDLERAADQLERNTVAELAPD